MKGKISLASLFMLTLLSVILLMATGYVNYKYVESVQKIKIKPGHENEPVKLMNFQIHPSEELTYRLYYEGVKNLSYDIEIFFDDVDESLSDLLYVYAKYNTYRTNMFSISEITRDNQLSFTYKLTSDYKYFELIFYMPEHIGNEAQNLHFDFKTYVNVMGMSLWKEK